MLTNKRMYWKLNFFSFSILAVSGLFGDLLALRASSIFEREDLAMEETTSSGAKRDSFSLQHVIQAEEALKVANVGNIEAAEKLFQQSFIDNSSGETPIKVEEEILMETQSQFLYRFGSGRPATEEAKYSGLFSRLPDFVPCTKDRRTIIAFGKMSYNAYEKERWKNATGYNYDESHGWDKPGLRGHIYTNKDRQVVIIAFKGTSTILLGGDTVAKDKYMDNVMFSCCCARVDLSWTPVCDCYKGVLGKKNICDNGCLRTTVVDDKNSYYQQALAVTQLVIARYPRSQIWFTGHSLGGALAGLMAVAVRRTAAITFESPGVTFYAKRLGLHDDHVDDATHNYPIWNFGVSSDPIYMGTCNGVASTCYLAGYALETVCRYGYDCVFQNEDWRPDVTTHGITWVLENILMKPQKYPLPECKPIINCIDCAKWIYFDKAEDLVAGRISAAR